jgi:AcrR family transcriptional regulator
MDRHTPARDRLTATAARLFRERGYHGVGLIEILAEAQAPKGSLYYAFPEGKADLALAAADLLAAERLAVLNAAFEPARDWSDGVGRYCTALAEEFDTGTTTSPVTPVLFDGPDNLVFRERLALLYGRWIRAFAYQAIRLGEEEDETTAEHRAETLLIALEGAWVVARARRTAEPLRDLAIRFAASICP